MEFLELYNKIKIKQKGKIVIIALGAFYIAMGIDAYLLNEIIGLKLTNFGKSFKVGIPRASLEKYIEKMTSIPYVIYDYCEDFTVDDYILYHEKRYILKCSHSVLFKLNKNEKIKCFFDIFCLKEKMLKFIEKYGSGNLGEVI